MHALKMTTIWSKSMYLYMETFQDKVVILMNSNSLWRNFKTTINLHIKVIHIYMCKISADSADSSQIFRRTLTYLQNVWKLFTDILQIGENLLQITAVLSQICHRYLQTFNIYVSLVRVIKFLSYLTIVMLTFGDSVWQKVNSQLFFSLPRNFLGIQRDHMDRLNKRM